MPNLSLGKIVYFIRINFSPISTPISGNLFYSLFLLFLLTLSFVSSLRFLLSRCMHFRAWLMSPAINKFIHLRILVSCWLPVGVPIPWTHYQVSTSSLVFPLFYLKYISISVWFLLNLQFFFDILIKLRKASKLFDNYSFCLLIKLSLISIISVISLVSITLESLIIKRCYHQL